MSAPLFAGIGGHQSKGSKTDEWLTPPHVIEALGGPSSFDLDPASVEAPPWPTAAQHYSRRDNGLSLPWFGRIWLNPPYSTAPLKRFMSRMAEHGCGVALIFARTETETFSRFVWESSSALLFVEGRLCFHRPDGTLVRTRSGAPANAGGPSVLCAYGNRDAEILADCGLPGAFVPLTVPRSIAVMAIESTWPELVRDWLRHQEGPVALADIYRALASHPKARRNQHFQAKIRQVLQKGGFQRKARGVWALPC